MLIPCDRHRPEDLRLWSELNRADHVRAKDPRLDRLVTKSIQEIRRFASAKRCYVSVSGGKDSTVLWHLAWRTGLLLPVRFLATEPLVDPYCRDVLAELQRRWPMDFREHINHAWRDTEGMHASGTFEAGLRAIRKETGTDRYILGLRAEESGIRKMSMRHLGLSTVNACRPLGWWTVADVFAYMALHDLPVHPNYAMLGGGRWIREHLRVAFLTLRHGEQFGRREWEAEYYPDILRRVT